MPRNSDHADETHFFIEVTHFIGQDIPGTFFGVSNLGPDSGELRPQMPVGSKRDTEFSVTHCADERSGTKDFLLLTPADGNA